MALTAKQKAWVKARNGHRCVHCWVDEKTGKWVRCKEHESIDVHHIISERWAKAHIPDFDPDRPCNAVTICSPHHTGKKKRR